MAPAAVAVAAMRVDAMGIDRRYQKVCVRVRACGLGQPDDAGCLFTTVPPPEHM